MAVPVVGGLRIEKVGMSGLGHITGATSQDLHRNCGKRCGKVPRSRSKAPRESARSSGLHHRGARERFRARIANGTLYLNAHIYSSTSSTHAHRHRRSIARLRRRTAVVSVPGWTVDARSRPSAGRAGAAISPTPTRWSSAAPPKLTSALLAAAPKLRVIARAGTGVDNVDLAAASARGILVMNAPGGNSVSVAEHALALMLSLARSVPTADATMKRGVWDKKKLTGAELRGKTLGLVRPRTDRPGSRGPRRARSAWTLSRTTRSSPRQVAGALGIQLLSLDGMCEVADYISLHLPATTETRHLFDADAAREVQARHADRQHRARRAHRRERARRRHRIAATSRAPASTCSRSSRRRTGGSRSCRRSSPRRTSPRRRPRRRSWSASKPRPRVRDYLTQGVIRNAVNFPAHRGRGDARASSRSSRSPSSWAPWSSQLADGPHQGDQRPALRSAGRLQQRPHRERGGQRAAAAAPLVGGHHRQRPRRRRRARHRDRRVAQLAGPELRQHHLGQGPHERGRALARRHGVRTGAPAPHAARWHRSRSAARGHAARHQERRQAGRHRPDRLDPRPARASTSPISRSAATRRRGRRRQARCDTG